MIDYSHIEHIVCAKLAIVIEFDNSMKQKKTSMYKVIKDIPKMTPDQLARVREVLRKFKESKPGIVVPQIEE